MNSIKCPNCGKDIDPVNEVCPNCGHVLNTQNNEINSKKTRKPLFTKKDYLIMLGCAAGIAIIVLTICLFSKQFLAAGIFGFEAFAFLLMFFIILFNERKN